MDRYKRNFVDKFKNFSDLAAHKKEGKDYSIVTHEVRGSNVAIVAPHGGKIDWDTEEMAKAIAADDYNLYIFEGTQPENSFTDLHITSTHFDEPRCLALVAKTDVTLTIHGNHFKEAAVYLSGMDQKLESRLTAAFNAASIKAITTGHPYQAGTKPENICNRNRSKQGVQLEFTQGIRDNPALRKKCVRIVRDVLRLK